MRLVVDKLAKTYGFLWAVKNLYFELAPGEFVALLGPNGAGKTTLLKLLSGLIAPTTGTIRIDGTAAGRDNVGLLAPADHLYDHLTVKENLRFFTALYNRRCRAEALGEVLAEVQLTKRADDYVANLSSGLKCRVSIAKWRLLDPALLLLDEPYGVLDGPGVDLLETFLQSQCAKGHIVIVASHHVARVLKLCSRALILHHGRLTFNETKQQPWSSFDQAFGEFLPHGESWIS